MPLAKRLKKSMRKMVRFHATDSIIFFGMHHKAGRAY